MVIISVNIFLKALGNLCFSSYRLGPRAADLIHLGAKFAPCMRKDAKIQKEIDKVREKERETACCIRNDDSGCVQSSRADCSVRLFAHL